MKCEEVQLSPPLELAGDGELPVSPLECSLARLASRYMSNSRNAVTIEEITEEPDAEAAAAELMQRWEDEAATQVRGYHGGGDVFFFVCVRARACVWWW